MRHKGLEEKPENRDLNFDDCRFRKNVLLHLFKKNEINRCFFKISLIIVLSYAI